MAEQAPVSGRGYHAYLDLSREQVTRLKLTAVRSGRSVKDTLTRMVIQGLIEDSEQNRDKEGK